MVLISDDGKVLLDSDPVGPDSNPLQFPRRLSAKAGFTTSAFVLLHTPRLLF
jgi:hypothetical protein